MQLLTDQPFPPRQTAARRHALVAWPMMAVLVFTLAGCAAAPLTDPAPGPIEPLQLETFAASWATNLDTLSDPVSELHVRGDQVYAYTESGLVSALGLPQGKQLWTTAIKGGARRQMWPPVVTQNRVVIPTRSTLEIINRYGELERSLDVRFSISTPLVGDQRGNLYGGGNFAGSSRAVAIALPADLKSYIYPTRWELLIPHGTLQAAAAVQGDSVYFAASDGNVYAVATASRAGLWSLPDGAFKTAGPIRGDLAVDENTLYVASGDSKFYAINRNSGRVRWQYFAGVPLENGPVLIKDLVLLQLPAGLAALNRNDGGYNRTPMWLLSDAKQFLSYDEQYVYVLTGDNRIAAIEKLTGRYAFKSRRNDFAVFAMNTSGDGIIYASTKGGRVVAIKAVLTPGGMGEVVRGQPARDAEVAFANQAFPTHAQ